MSISHRTRVARAKRKLRQMLEDEPLLKQRAADVSHEERKLAIRVFKEAVLNQRRRIEELERNYVG